MDRISKIAERVAKEMGAAMRSSIQRKMDDILDFQSTKSWASLSGLGGVIDYDEGSKEVSFSIYSFINAAEAAAEWLGIDASEYYGKADSWSDSKGVKQLLKKEAAKRLNAPSPSVARRVAKEIQKKVLKLAVLGEPRMVEGPKVEVDEYESLSEGKCIFVVKYSMPVVQILEQELAKTEAVAKVGEVWSLRLRFKGGFFYKVTRVDDKFPPVSYTGELLGRQFNVLNDSTYIEDESILGENITSDYEWYIKNKDAEKKRLEEEAKAEVRSKETTAKKFVQEIVDFVKSQRTSFMEDNIELDGVAFSTRENGNVGAETPGKEDINEARRLMGLIKGKFGNRVEVTYDTADEWTSVIVKVKSGGLKAASMDEARIAERVVRAIKFDTRKELQKYKTEHHPEPGTKLELRNEQEMKKRYQERK